MLIHFHLTIVGKCRLPIFIISQAQHEFVTRLSVLWQREALLSHAVREAKVKSTVRQHMKRWESIATFKQREQFRDLVELRREKLGKNVPRHHTEQGNSDSQALCHVSS